MNKLIISEFEKLTKQIDHDIDNSKNSNERMKNLFRLKQIGNALNIIKNYKQKISSGIQLKDVKGIGKGVISRIDEILGHGKLSEITMQTQDINISNSIDELKEIYGIGDKMANDLVKNYDIKSVEELVKANKNGDIKLNNNVLVGLKYRKKYKQQIPRCEMQKMETYIQTIAKKINGKLEVRICGSYRREKPFSNDIDCMLAHPSIVSKDDILNKKNYLHKFIEYLKDEEFIVDSLTSDTVDTKFMGFCQYKKKPIRRIDIRYIPYESYYSALLYFTGSGSFNQAMRKEAKKKGYKLNEYGLFKIKSDDTYKIIKVKSEKDIFKKLGMDYVEPKDRL